MATDALSTEEFVDAAERLEPGDEVAYVHAHHEFKNPLTVRSAEAITWEHPDEPWRTAEIVLQGTQGGEKLCRVVEDEHPPRQFASNTYFDVVALELAAVETEDEEDHEPDGPSAGYWYGRCGKGPMTVDGVKRHNGQVHDGEPIVRDVEPADASLAGDGSTVNELSDDVAEMFDDAAREASSDSAHKYDTGGVLDEDPADPDDPAWLEVVDSNGGVQCLNCGATVTKRYVDVFCPEGQDAPKVCPNCPDRVRDHEGNVREMRGQGTGTSS